MIMQAHQLTKNKSKARRIGRGGKRGSYSGRGIKGQKARAGRRIRPQVRDIIKKLHKRRGHGKSNRFQRGFQQRPVTLRYEALENKFSEGERITPKRLVEAGILRARQGKEKIKVLGGAKAPAKRFIFSDGIAVSRSLKNKLGA